MSDWIDVVAENELAPGTWRTIDVDGTDVAVFNLDGAYYAIEDVCTHDGGVLTGGEVDGDVIVCPRHGARFSIRTGEVLAPPAYEDVPTFPVRIEAGIVQVRDARWD
ncbi:MAG TPA: non-heme iron oxygenase ferredoxin subunit [Casimicrobiaceae bacterium]|jgi:3-phenylpropionate/trans-cinnamate dioxygenase ferredoxin subunit|nr:non-heme iron oxygenase ferredoxin subunit [Casimicrobiaceae bacterium]HXU66707.1 non-heme iron oxygenase ferredoxin subunit [Casimicrobiaceae bacterium]